MANTLVRHTTFPPQLSHGHRQLQKTLVTLCEEVQQIVNGGLRKEVDDVQHEAGLKLLTHQGGCPQNVLLLAPHRLALITPQAQPRPTWATTNNPLAARDRQLCDEALTQIDHILASLDEVRASHLAETLDARLREALRDGPLDINDDTLLSDGGNEINLPEFNDSLWEPVRRLLGDDLLGDTDTFTPTERGGGVHVIIDPLAVYKAQATISQTSSKPHTPTAATLTAVQIIERAAPEIEYYALKLLMCATRRSLSLTSLTRVVRIHELAHLVTHLGLDASWQHWHTFYSASDDHIEGSAQDITHRLLERRFRHQLMTPRAKRRAQSKRDLYSFKRLLKDQPRPYLVYAYWRWLMKDHQERRQWLIQARVTGNFAPF